MKKQEWSEEPWRYESGSAYKGQGQMGSCRILKADREEPGTRPTERDANVKRAIACVNACAGIENPEAIGEVMEALELARDTLTNSGTECMFDGGACGCMGCIRRIARNKAIAALAEAGWKP